jgi:hypothetical protein
MTISNYGIVNNITGVLYNIENDPSLKLYTRSEQSIVSSREGVYEFQGSREVFPICNYENCS